MERRPLKTRGKRWAGVLAGFLVRCGVPPNGISVAGIFFALLAGLALMMVPGAASVGRQMVLLFVAAACIQLRLLCNMLDGMVALEGGLGSVAGDIFNEFPDRIADVLILLGAGAAVTLVPWAVHLGWLAALLAVLTAYVRALGASLGTAHAFDGPMAKPHRMALLTAACLVSIAECLVVYRGRVLFIALWLIAAGCIGTLARRLRRIVRELRDAG
jgi:phosphatidylglycerophosphate synthase